MSEFSLPRDPAICYPATDSYEAIHIRVQQRIQQRKEAYLYTIARVLAATPRARTMDRVASGALPPAASREAIEADGREAAARYEAGRRRAARSAGYYGPLTRAEASRQQLARLAARS